MNFVRTRLILTTLILAAAALPLCLTAAVRAEPLWARLVTANRVEADPEADYLMTRENGPWMILASSFSGEGAEGQARELVLELRRRYKLEAYVHDRTFDYTGDVEGRGVDRLGRPKRMKYQKDTRVHEIAVLVGNYPTVDDPQAQRTLRKLKYLRPDTLSPKTRKKTSQTLAGLRTIQRVILPDGDDRKTKGPMGHAMVTRNPLLPREYFVPKGLDKLVVEMNKGVEYSLLDCPGKYTVKVATFTGTVVLDQRKVREHEQGSRKMKSRLAEAAENAHRLTLALREKGYEAYEFHDRYASMVTVGSFDSPGTPREDGKIEINPRIHAVFKTFAATPAPAGATPAGLSPTATGAVPFNPGYRLKSVAKIPLDPNPQIVEAPKVSISTAFLK